MDLRLALYRLAGEHRLDGAALRRLEALAGFAQAPADVATRLARGVAVLAAALLGLGVVLWVAANWAGLGRFERFAVLQAVVVVMCLAGWLRPAARAPLGLLALLGIGGLFAYFGQTYQTGADPWQLFALWAALALPLALGVRSDVVWAPWALVAMTGVSLWVHAHTGHRWRVLPQDLLVHLIGWGAALALVVALRLAPRAAGTGVWSVRTAVTLAVVMITFTAIGALFHDPIAPHYALALALLAGAAALLAGPAFELYGLSAVVLAIDTLLVAGLAEALLDRPHRGDPIGQLLLVGLLGAGLLAASVKGVMHLAQRHAAREGGAA